MLAGAAQVTVACPLPDAALTLVGGPGGVPGVTAFDVPGALVPTEFVATTWNVYVVPLTRLVTVMLVAEAPAPTGVPAAVPT